MSAFLLSLLGTLLLYIGPGLGATTILIVLVVLALVLFSLGYVLWVPLKRMFRRGREQ